MAKNSTSFDLLDIAKNAKAPLPLLLAVWGLYGGQYAKLFDTPFNIVASYFCLFSMAVGIGLLIVMAIHSVFRQSAM